MKALVKKWRKRTKELRKQMSHNNTDASDDKIAALIYKECADDLERCLLREEEGSGG